MIQQLLDPRFLQDRTADLAQELRQRCNRFETATPEILSEAEKNGVSLNDLREALTQVSELSSSGNFTRQPHEAAWLPRDPLLSIMQSALEEFYIQAGAVQKVPRRGFRNWSKISSRFYIIRERLDSSMSASAHQREFSCCV